MKLRRKYDQYVNATILAFAWMALVAWMPAGLTKIILSSAFLLTVPGYLSYKLLRKNPSMPSFWEGLSYSVAFSFLVMMVTGLGVNEVLPHLGVPAPLSTNVLTWAIGGATTMLVWLCALFGRQIRPTWRKPELSIREMWLGFMTVVTLVLSILGAVSLNNGGTNAFSVIMLGLVGVTGLILAGGRRLFRLNAGAFLVYMSSLAMLFATSLRGWYITGHDVMQEYEVFQLTAKHSLWSMNFLHDPYNACLSITILPTVLQRLTGMSDPYVFKILFQLVFALVPVLVYLLATRFVSLAAAGVVAFVYISFPTFMTDFPMLNRQETAFLFFGLAFCALFDQRMNKWTRRLLVGALFLGMVLSHYSTSYVAVGAVIIYKVLEYGVMAIGRMRKKPANSFTRLPLGIVMTILLAAMVYVWNGPLTNTAGQFDSTVYDIGQALPTLLAKSPNAVSNMTQLFYEYVNNVPQTRDLPANNYYPASLTNQYTPAQSSATVAPLTSFGHWLSNLGVPVGTLLDVAKSGYGTIVEGLIVLGLVITAWKRDSRLKGAFVLMGVTFLGLIVGEVLMPSAIDYGLLRLMQQGLMFLALPMVLASYAITGWLKIKTKYRLGLIATAFVILFALTSGMVAAITGGYPQSLVVANSGFYYEAYYTHADEIAGFNWLDENAPVGSVVDTDEFARRKMITYADIYARTEIAPAGIAQDAYFYLSYGDTTTDRMPHYFGDVLIYQQPPYAFLNATKNLVYTNGDVEIYR